MKATFEEQFPSLEGKSFDKFWNGIDLATLDDLMLWERDVKENCLDKQKVKESIDKIFDIDDHEDEVHNKMIKKELGLDK